MAPAPRRTMMLIAIVAVVVVVGLVLALALSGAFTSKSSGGPGGSSAFASSRSAAQSAADGYPGGGWQLIIADGTASPTVVSESTSNLTQQLATGCTFMTAVGAPTMLTMGAVTDVSMGIAGGWLFLFKNTGATSVLAVGVSGSGTNVLGTVSGSGCFGGFLGAFSALGNGVVDSSQAAAAANTHGGSAFLTAHPGAWASYSLTGGASFLGISTPSTWGVTYSGCPITPTTASTSAEFSATINATSGAVTHTSNQTLTCPGASGGGGGGGTALGTALSLAPATVLNVSGAEYDYTIGVTSAASGMTLSDLTFAVKTAGGAVVPVTGSSVYAYSGGSLVGLFGMTSGTWSTGGSTSVTSSISFGVIATQNLAGDEFTVLGAGAYSGSLSVTLPVG